MMAEKRRTYVDTCVLIEAYRDKTPLGAKCRAAVDDPDRLYLSSLYLELELLPKPKFNGRDAELKFYAGFLAETERVSISEGDLRNVGLVLAEKYGLAAMDAIHVAVAIAGRADELLTAEGPQKAICSVVEVKVTSLR